MSWLDLSNIRTGISKKPWFFVILELTEADMVSASLRVSKLCYSYALETKHMFSSRLLREPTCYLYPITRRRAMTALSSAAYSSFKLPLIKRIKHWFFSPPPHNIHHCVTFTPTCICVFCGSNSVCVWLCCPWCLSYKMAQTHLEKV